MKRLFPALAMALFVVVVAVLPAAAQQSSDSATLAGDTGVIGQQFELTLEVFTAEGATVEVDPANESWAGVEVVELVSADTVVESGQALHTLVLQVAIFQPGVFAFSPAVNVIEGTDVSGRLLEPLELVAITTLVQRDPLELTPLVPPASIDGAQSPFLVPAAILGLLLAAAGIVFAVYFGARWLLLRRPEAGPDAPVPTESNPDLAYAESILDADPIGAYRHMAATVRSVLAGRYGFPAKSLTTTELERRMGTAGVDRWQARLVSGLLTECDAVVYAGYRPAAERRHADFAMAQQIVEGTA